jgi:hypothetical protein
LSISKNFSRVTENAANGAGQIFDSDKAYAAFDTTEC